MCHMDFISYMKRTLLHYRASFKRRDGKTPGEHVFGREMRLPLTKSFLFGDTIKYKHRDGVIGDAWFVMERGSNTSLIVDRNNEQLRLAHGDQITSATSTLDSSLNTTFSPHSPTSHEGDVSVSQSPAPEFRSPDPSTLPPPVSSQVLKLPSPVVRKSQRQRKAKCVTDYDDL